MLDHLRERLKLGVEATPEALKECGNTVSSTIPILMNDLRTSGRLKPGKRSLLIGFGVGLSWAGCVWTETWAAKQANSADAKPADAKQGNGEAADADLVHEAA
jgi:3-oxoacyl-[acyl-carrier-protein] synthase-3